MLILAALLGLADPVTVTQHVYRDGETFEYVFEDTDNIYQAEKDGSSIRPRKLVQVRELEIRLRIGVAKGAGGALTRTMTFTDVRYRAAAPEKFSEVTPGPIAKLVDKFPDPFIYEYVTDGQAIGELQKIFAPYLTSEPGQFLYYKALDVHTFQATIDGIPADLAPGQMKLLPSKDIGLGGGSFANRQPALTYHHIDLDDGVRCAVFKDVTVGNQFKTPAGTVQSDYQFTFVVPLEGESQGLLDHGELQEAVFGEMGGAPVYILRQLSLSLQTEARHRLAR